jgi:hypothetical protein
MKKIIFLLIISQYSNFVFAKNNKYEKIKLKTSAKLVIAREIGFEPEAIALSPDGKYLGWIDKFDSNFWWNPINMWQAERISGEYRNIQVLEKFEGLNAYTTISYTNDNAIVAAEYEHTGMAAIQTEYNYVEDPINGQESSPGGCISCIKISYSQFNERKLCIDDFGLLEGDYLRHPRISPNGRYLALYVAGKVEGNRPGIYVYDLHLNEFFNYGVHTDKHPTWSPDGTKILFHYQTGGIVNDGSLIEKAVIGYYDVSNGPIGLIKNDRILLDDINQANYIYHKHPSVVPNTDLLFFHGKIKEGGKRKLLVRKLEANSQIYYLKLKGTTKSAEIYKAGHPGSSYSTHELFFVGQERAKKKNRAGKKIKGPKQIYKLDAEAIREIEAIVN